MILDMFLNCVIRTLVAGFRSYRAGFFKGHLRLTEMFLMVVSLLDSHFLAVKQYLIFLGLRHLLHRVVYNETLREPEVKRIEQLFVKFFPVCLLHKNRVLREDWGQLHELLPSNFLVWMTLATKGNKVELARNLLGTNFWIVVSSLPENAEYLLLVEELLSPTEEHIGQLGQKLFLCDSRLKPETILGRSLKHIGFTGCARASRPGTYHIVINGECRLDVTLDPILEALKITGKLPIEDLLNKRLPVLKFGRNQLSWEHGQISVR